MQSPILAFLEWYSSLPVPQRRDIASFVSHFNLGYDEVLAVDNRIEDAFVRCVMRYDDDKFHGVGVALTLRATIEFFFIRRRGSRAGWDDTRAFLAGAKSFFASKGMDDMVESAESFLREVPFKEGQWLASAERWRALTDTALSDESIDAWWHAR